MTTDPMSTDPMSTDQDKPRRGRPSTFDRHRAVELAMENYWREGVHALSLNEMCRRAQISKPSLYRQFGDEDGLIAAALQHYRALVVSPMLAALELQHSFGELSELLIQGMTADHGTPPGCLFTQMRFVRQRLGSISESQVRAIEQERLIAFRVWYQRALDQGQVDASISPALAARYIDTQMANVMVQMGAGDPPKQIREQARLSLRLLQA